MHKTKALLGILFIAVTIVSCHEKPLQQTKPTERIIEPVNLQYASNVIFLDSLVEDVNSIDSVLINGQLISFYQSKRMVAFQAADFKNPLLLMQLWIKGNSIDILLKKSRKHKVMFSFNPRGNKYKSVLLAGEMNGWNFKQTPLEWHDTSWQQVLFLEDGKYPYQIVADERWLPDPNNPFTILDEKGKKNSVLTVDKGQPDRLPKLAIKSIMGNTIKLAVYNKPSQFFVFFNNQLMNYNSRNISNQSIEIMTPVVARNYKSSYLRVSAANKYGFSNDIRIPLTNGQPKLNE